MTDKYTNADITKIRSEYNKIYDPKIEGIKREVDLEYKKELGNHIKHEELRNLALKPFLERGGIKNFELVWIEPLKFARNQKEIDSNVPIFDFLVCQFTEDEHQLKKVILGEIKGRDPSRF